MIEPLSAYIAELIPRLHTSILKMEAAYSFETSVFAYQAIRNSSSEDHNLENCCYENFELDYWRVGCA
jgi:hypothetical protein